MISSREVGQACQQRRRTGAIGEQGGPLVPPRRLGLPAAAATATYRNTARKMAMVMTTPQYMAKPRSCPIFRDSDRHWLQRQLGVQLLGSPPVRTVPPTPPPTSIEIGPLIL